MTRKETTAIALKCFAIYILSQTILALPAIATLGTRLKYMGDGKPTNIWIIVISVSSLLAGVIAAFLVWKFTNSLLTKETTPDNSGDLGVNGVMKIILACMGVYFIIDAAMVFPSALVSYRFSTQVPNSNPNALMFLVTQVIELLFGCLLIAKPGKWVKAIRSIGEI